MASDCFWIVLLNRFIYLVCHLTNGTRGATKGSNAVATSRSLNVVAFSHLLTHKHSRDKCTKASKTDVIQQTEVLVFESIKTHLLSKHQIGYGRTTAGETTHS